MDQVNATQMWRPMPINVQRVPPPIAPRPNGTLATPCREPRERRVVEHSHEHAREREVDDRGQGASPGKSDQWVATSAFRNSGFCWHDGLPESSPANIRDESRRYNQAAAPCNGRWRRGDATISPLHGVPHVFHRRRAHHHAEQNAKRARHPSAPTTELPRTDPPAQPAASAREPRQVQRCSTRSRFHSPAMTSRTNA